LIQINPGQKRRGVYCRMTAEASAVRVTTMPRHETLLVVLLLRGREHGRRERATLSGATP